MDTILKSELTNSNLIIDNGLLPSDIKFEFVNKERECTACSVDGYHLIKDNITLFKNFLDVDNIYIKYLFNMIENIINL